MSVCVCVCVRVLYNFMLIVLVGLCSTCVQIIIFMLICIMRAVRALMSA